MELTENKEIRIGKRQIKTERGLEEGKIGEGDVCKDWK
jgi:hypothetical protein